MGDPFRSHTSCVPVSAPRPCFRPPAWPTAEASSSSPIPTTTRSSSATPTLSQSRPSPATASPAAGTNRPASISTRQSERGWRQPVCGRHEQSQDSRDRYPVGSGQDTRDCRPQCSSFGEGFRDPGRPITCQRRGSGPSLIHVRRAPRKPIPTMSQPITARTPAT